MTHDTTLFEFSLLGRKLAARTGILELMDDLGQAMTVALQIRMLGGGNPAAVPEFQALAIVLPFALLAGEWGSCRCICWLAPFMT